LKTQVAYKDTKLHAISTLFSLRFKRSKALCIANGESESK